VTMSREGKKTLALHSMWRKAPRPETPDVPPGGGRPAQRPETLPGSRQDGSLILAAPPDKAPTAAGTEVPVEWRVVEALDLKTSHSDAHRPKPDYPAEL